jgi:hypothetical protein
MKIIMKLKTKEIMSGVIFSNSFQKSTVVFISTEGDILTSIINKVRAMAKTPSQKASSREFGFDSDISIDLK